jgi:hypothetical protein
VQFSAWRNENKSVRRRKIQILVPEARAFTEENEANKEREFLSSFPWPARSLSVGQASRLSPSSKYFAHRSVVLRHTGNSNAHGGNFKVRDRRDACPTAWLWIYRSCLLSNSMLARIQPPDFPGPDGLERLRRDRRGSAVAFHAGTRHPQNPPDKGSRLFTRRGKIFHSACCFLRGGFYSSFGLNS